MSFQSALPAHPHPEEAECCSRGRVSHSIDIEAYVRDELVGDDSTWMQELRRKLCARSAGMFLWVVLVVFMLNKVYGRGRGLRAMLKKLDEIPSDLRQVYDKILSAASEGLRERTKLLQWVLVVKRPLRPSEPYSAVHHACSSDDTDDVFTLSQDRLNTWLVDCSCGLLEPIEVAELYGAGDLRRSRGWEEPVVQFIHETVRDYLLDRKPPSEEATTGTEAHVSLRVFQEDTCQLVVAEDSLRCLLDLPKGAPSIKDAVAQHPLANYTAQCWWRHMHESNNMYNQTLIGLALQLLTDSRCLLLWVQFWDPGKGYWATDPSLTLEKLAPPLYYSASLGLLGVVSSLLEQKADVNAKGGRHGNALQAASYHGYEKVVQILLGQGAGVNIQGGFYSNALRAASWSGMGKVVQLLLDHGADINARGPWGSALEAASGYGNEKVAQMLLEHGAKAS